jgi:type II secretory pathway predicted ATPase ExeA
MKAVDMYEAYFNLQKRPFSSTPDPSCFFAPESIQELFDELMLRAESGQGVGILTAPAGTGKTLLCRRLASELSSRWTPVFLANANFPTRRALLQSILFELGKPYSGLEEQELRLSIYASLRELTQAGRGAALIVDEAHLLSDRLLEELRMLASLAEGKLPLARVILAGQPLLEERMMQPALEALNQRVACQVFLEPLSRRQSIDYVEYRIEWAGGICTQVFTDAALDSIAVGAGGLPRCLNQLCDHAMLLAYVQEQELVTREIVEEALLTLRQLPLRWNAPLAGQDSNLSGDDHAGEIDQRQIDDDGCDLSSEGMESADSYGAGVEMTCIEIGGDADEPVPNVETPRIIETPKVSMLRARPRTGLLGAGVVPLPDASPQALRGMVDELVVDRYARLDSSAPRLFRTFDDAAIPESWQSITHDDIPAAPEPPAKSAWSAADIVIEESADELEVRLDADPRLVDPAEPVEIDDLLGSSVMDACREVQAAIDGGTVRSTHDAHWWNAPSSAVSMEEDVVIPDSSEKYESEYDVVEPEHGARQDVRQDTPRTTRAEGETASESLSSASHVDGRYVPKPKYRNIFSTLRRRIGRGK